MVALFRVFSTIVPIILASMHVSASPTPSESLHGLLARAAPIIDPKLIPDQCRAECTSVVNQLNTCADPSCICTDANIDIIATCLDCVVKVPGSQTSNITAQDAADALVAGCKNAGKPVKSVTISAPASASPASPTSPVAPVSSTSPTSPVAPESSTSPEAPVKGNSASHFGVVNMGTLATVALGITLVLA